MNSLPEFFSVPIMQRIGLTLLHSLWQIVLIAVATGLILHVGHNLKTIRSAHSRYLVQCCGLFLMLLAPIATFFLLQPPTSELLTQQVTQLDLSNRYTDLPDEMWTRKFDFDAGVEHNRYRPVIPQNNVSRLPSTPNLNEPKTKAHANNWLIGTAWIWLIGAFGMLAHSFGQYRGARKLSTSSTMTPRSNIARIFKTLVANLGVSQNAEVRMSKLVDVPTLIGWLRPVILLPPAIVSGLSARELELILLHELIHIKRHDYLVNVFQTAIESLLFFHPSVWWLSRQIRIEREFAADEQVVRWSQDQITYVQALLQLEQFRGESNSASSPALAATDGSLLTRVQRIIATESRRPAQTRSPSDWFHGFGRKSDRSPALRVRIPIAVILLPVLLTGGFLLAANFNSDTNDNESIPMSRYSDNFTRMQRPDISFDYGETNINDLHPWQGPFGMASREIDYDDGWELWCAAADGKADIVKHLIEKDPRLKDLAFRYHSPLDLAVYGGHTECVRILLDAGTELTEKWGWYGWKRMMSIATEMGHDEIYDMMLQRITETLNYHPEIQLMIQALCDQEFERMVQLIDEDPNRVHIADADGNTALHWAVVSRQIPMIDLLVQRGADPSRRNGASAMPHQVKMWTNLKKEMTRGLEASEHAAAARDRLLELGAEIDFHTAIDKRDFDLVKKMLADDPSLVHKMPGHLSSPLNRAVGSVEMIQLLLDHGADPNMTEHTAPFGCALYSAVAGNQYDSAKLLLENGAEPMQYSDSSGDTLFAVDTWIKDEEARQRMIELLTKFSGKEYIVIPQRNEKPEHAVVAAAVREVLARDSVTDWQVGHLLDVILLYKDVDLLEVYVERFGNEAKSRIADVDSRPYEGRLLDRLEELGAKVKPVGIEVRWMGATVLHWNKDVSMVAEFVEAGGDINSINIERQRTALSNAAERGDVDMVQELLKHGADPNLPTRFGPNRPVNLAKKEGHTEIVQLLLNHGADSYTQTKPEAQASGFVSTNSKPKGAADSAGAKETPASTAKSFSRTPARNDELWNASHAGDLEKVKQLIESGADPNSVDSNGSGTLLNFHPEVTRYLLQNGANPDLQRNENILPVLVGVAGFNTECLKLMLDAGANPNIASDHNGETALHHSVCGDRLEEVQALLDAGADPNKKTIPGMTTYMLWRDARVRGETALHRAAAYGTPEVIKLLLDNGADPTLQDTNNDTPLSWASWHRRDKSIIDLLAYEGSGVGPDIIRQDEHDGQNKGTENASFKEHHVDPVHPVKKPLDVKKLAKTGDYEKLLELWHSGERFDLGKVFERAVTDFRTVKRKKGHQQILVFCIEQGLDPMARVDWMKQPAICSAAMFGNVELIEHVASNLGLPENPFVRASVGDVDFLKALAESKGDEGKQTISELHDENGFNLLHYACSSGLGCSNDDYKSKLEATCDFLIECGVATDLAIENEISLTPALFCAWFGGNPVIMQSLLDAGQIKVEELHQPVEFAFEPHQRSGEPHEEVASVILKNGFDINSIYVAQKRTLLHGSSNRGSIKAVEWLLNNGANPNKLDDQGRTALHSAAIRNRHTIVVNLLLEHGADPSRVDGEGNTARELASTKGREKVVAFLDAKKERQDRGTENISFKEHPVNPVQKFLPSGHPFIVAVREVDLTRIKELIDQDKSLVTAQVRGDVALTGKIWKDGQHVEIGEDGTEHAGPLHFAAFNGHKELAQLLIDSGADINAPATFGEKKGTTPVTIAAWEGNKETLNVILEAARASGLALQLNSALFTSLVHRSKEKADLLIEYGAEHDVFTAAMAGESEVLRQLIESAPDSVNLQHPEYGRTPLEQALKVGQTETAELLANNGAVVTPPSAAAMGRVEEVKAVIKRDKEAATRHFGSYPLLIWAINGGQSEIVKLLLEFGSDPNGGDRWDYSPLSHVAKIHGEVGKTIVDMLVAAGADPKLKSGNKTPIEWALVNKNRHVHHRFVYHIENDIEVSDEDSKFWTAVDEGDLATVKASLEKDSSLASKRFPTRNELSFLSDGFPMFVAAANGHWEIAKLLIEHGADPDAKRDLADTSMLGLGGDHREIGKPILFAYAQRNFEMIHYLLDQGATVHAHGYADVPFATQIHQDATEAGAHSSLVLRSIPNLDAEHQAKIASVPDDAPEVVKLYDRILALGAIPNHYSLAQVGDHETIEILLENHPEGISHDHWGGNVHEALLYGSAWRGFDKTVEICMDICADRHTTYAAHHCIFNAIKSHNRPGSFESYYRIIELNLDYLRERDAFGEHREFMPLQMLTENYLRKRVWGGELPTVEQQLKLAQLCLDKGVDVNHVTAACRSTALDLAIQNGHEEYAEFLRENGGLESKEIKQDR